MRRLSDEHPVQAESPPQGAVAPGPTVTPGHGASAPRSGVLQRPIDRIRRPAVTEPDAATELERYKLSLRKYAPVQKGVEALPWEGRFECARCEETLLG